MLDDFQLSASAVVSGELIDMPPNHLLFVSNEPASIEAQVLDQPTAFTIASGFFKAPGAILAVFLSMATVLPAFALTHASAPVISAYNSDVRFSVSLSRRFANAVINADLSDSERSTALRSSSEAQGFVVAQSMSRLPDTISIADDGFTSLQWRGEHKSILIVFSGSEVAAFSIRKPSGSFTENLVEFDITKKAPFKLRSELTTI